MATALMTPVLYCVAGVPPLTWKDNSSVTLRFDASLASVPRIEKSGEASPLAPPPSQPPAWDPGLPHVYIRADNVPHQEFEPWTSTFTLILNRSIGSPCEAGYEGACVYCPCATAVLLDVLVLSRIRRD